MLMCSQGPGTGAQFLLGGTQAAPQSGGQSEVPSRSEQKGGEGEGGVCRGVRGSGLGVRFLESIDDLFI